MPETDIGKATTTNVTDALKDFSVAPQTTDGATDQKENIWINQKWPQHLGYYKSIPELHIAINTKAAWTVGKGINTEEYETSVLGRIRGRNKESFNSILENQIRVYHITYDSFAEIIRDEDGNFINLKPLDPSSIKTVANREGLIIRYEQISKSKKPNKILQPDQIFHLSKNRIADEIHGTGIIDAVESIILMRNESMEDMRILMHRNIMPLRILEVDTDDDAKLAHIKTQYETAIKNREVIIIPKGTVKVEDSGTAPNATLNPLPWIDGLNDRFYEAVGVPKIIIGGSKALTEASAKIAYLAFQQTIEEEQLYIEEQVGMQLGLKIELEFPASLENEMLSDKPKEGEEEAAAVSKPEIEQEQPNQPNDTTAEMEGKK